MWILIWAVVIVLEWVFSFFWWPIYFRYGIPIFSRQIPGTTNLNWNWWLEDLERRTKHQHNQPLLYQPLSATEYAFREQLRVPTMSYPRIMRGLISYNSQTKVITVTGFLNWSLIVPLLYAIQLIPTGNTDVGLLAVFAIAFVVIVIMCYGIQHQRFERVVLALRAFNP